MAVSLLMEPAVAQQPDIPTLQRAVAVLQAQRNTAYDLQAQSEIRAAGLAQENEQLKVRIKELEAKLPPEPDKK